MNSKFKIALLVGRFQPFHKGHLYLIKKALEVADQLIIGIGSANITDVNNPLDYEIRRKIIKAVLYKEKLQNKVIKIVPLDDFYNNEKWKNNVQKQLSLALSGAERVDLVVGNNEWTNNILKQAGYKILECPYFNRYLYEGWRIRRMIVEGKNFEKRIPNYLYKFVLCSMLRVTCYANVVLGGTFDHFHVGHKALIKKALEIGKKVTIGLTTEELYKNKFLSQHIEPYEVREKNLKKYCRNIIPISDIYGTTLENKEIDAIVVSRETLTNAIKINEERKIKKLKPFQIVIVEDILADDGKIVSSERIRRGEINREGKSYELMVTRLPTPEIKGNGGQDGYLGNKKQLILPENLRERLREPIGSVISSFSISDMEGIVGRLRKASLVISVGDIITMELIRLGVEPDVKVIDLRSRRESILNLSASWRIKTKIINRSGTISFEAVKAIKKTIDSCLENGKKSTIVIDGEEDLLVLPAILLVPLGSVVCYGQWDKGAVIVEVTEEKKQEVAEILEKFQRF